MNFLNLILDFLHLKWLEAGNWAAHKLRALRRWTFVLILFYVAPFLLAFFTGQYADFTRTAFLIGGIVAMIAMIQVYVRAEVLLLVAVRGGNKVISLILPKFLPENASADEVKLVRQTLRRGFFWMLTVFAVYLAVPVWGENRTFGDARAVVYGLSLIIVSVMLWKMLGYPEDHNPRYRKAVMLVALASFGGIILATFGVNHWFDGLGGKVKGMGVLGWALLFGIGAVICAFVSALQKDDNRKKAFAVLWKVAAACAAVLVIWFGLSTAVHAVAGYFKSSDGDRPSATSTAPPPRRPAPVPQPITPRAPAPVPQGSDPSDPKKASRPGKSAATGKHQAVVKKTPHAGDELDAVTDILDGVHNRREAAGM